MIAERAFVSATRDQGPYVGIVLLGIAMGGVAGSLVGLLFRHLRPASIGYLLGITPALLFLGSR